MTLRSRPQEPKDTQVCLSGKSEQAQGDRTLWPAWVRAASTGGVVTAGEPLAADLVPRGASCGHSWKGPCGLLSSRGYSSACGGGEFRPALGGGVGASQA